jgi:Sap, sulfolipid-1-addressing protein
MIGEIVLLALGASIFPLLLACVAIMISRPEPRLLLVAFYVGGMIMSVAIGIAILALLKNGHSVLGSTKSAPAPGVSIVTGALGLLLAWLMVSSRGHAILDRWGGRRRRKPKTDAGPSWAERRLGGASWKIALLVGAVINLPGPFYLLALGKIAKAGYSTPHAIALILLFNLIMFWLLEGPLGGYLVAPEKTSQWVASLSQTISSNGLRITGSFVGIVAIGLIVQGIAAA